MVRLLIAMLVLIAGCGISMYFDMYLHIKEPVVYFLLGVGTLYLHIVILYKTTVRK